MTIWYDNANLHTCCNNVTSILDPVYSRHHHPCNKIPQRFNLIQNKQEPILTLTWTPSGAGWSSRKLFYVGKDTYFFSGYLVIFVWPGYIFLSDSSLSGCDNWTRVTELVWVQSRSCPRQPITELADCSEPSHWSRGSRTGGKQSAVINLVTMELAQRLWPGRQSLGSLKKNPRNVKKLELIASVFKI